MSDDTLPNLPDQKTLEKEIGDYLSRKYGSQVKIISTGLFPASQVDGEKKTKVKKDGVSFQFDMKPELKYRKGQSGPSVAVRVVFGGEAVCAEYHHDSGPGSPGARWAPGLDPNTPGSTPKVFRPYYPTSSGLGRLNLEPRPGPSRGFRTHAPPSPGALF